MKKDYINSDDTETYNPYLMKISSINDFKISLNLEKEILYFIHSDILKNNDKQLEVYNTIILLKDIIINLISNAFYFCLLVKFPFI